jgi:hypothetical protein
MGRQSREKNEQTKQQIEHWRAEANRMWASAHQSIQRVKEVQDKLNEHRRALGHTHHVAPWVEG